MEFGLSKNTVNILKIFFARFPEIDEVKIYGSRAKGNYRKGSDVDFAIYGNISFRLLARIIEEIDELATPYKYDVTDYKTIKNQDLKAHIDRIGKTFYNKETQTF